MAGTFIILFILIFLSEILYKYTIQTLKKDKEGNVISENGEKIPNYALYISSYLFVSFWLSIIFLSLRLIFRIF